jgi:hypothetical protein
MYLDRLYTERILLLGTCDNCISIASSLCPRSFAQVLATERHPTYATTYTVAVLNRVLTGGTVGKRWEKKTEARILRGFRLFFVG